MATNPPIKVKGTEIPNQSKIRTRKVVNGIAPVLSLPHKSELIRVRIRNERPGK